MEKLANAIVDRELVKVAGTMGALMEGGKGMLGGGLAGAGLGAAGGGGLGLLAGIPAALLAKKPELAALLPLLGAGYGGLAGAGIGAGMGGQRAVTKYTLAEHENENNKNKQPAKDAE